MKDDDLLSWLQSDTAAPATQTRRALDIGSASKAEELDEAEVRRLKSEDAARDAAAKKKAEEAAFVGRNAQPGVPLDTQTGLDAGMRAKLSFERDPAKRLEWLAKQPGIDGVRMADDGESLIATVKSNDGKAKDILVDERRMSAKDFADATSDVPAATMSALVAYLTGGTSLLTQALLTAGTGAATRMSQDAIARGAMGTDQSGTTVGDIVGENAGSFAFDVATPLAFGAGKRIAQRIIAPFGRSAGPLEQEAAIAASKLKVPLSAAQRTGSPALARVETFTSRLPGGGPLLDQKQAQEEAIRKAQEYLLGGPASAIPSGQQIADKAGDVLAAARTSEAAAVRAERDAAAAAAQQQIAAAIDAGLTPQTLSTSQAGAVLRRRVVGLRDAFKQQANQLYSEVYDKAGGEFVEVPLGPVKQLLDEIRTNTSSAAVKIAPGVSRALSVASSLPAGGTKTVQSPILDQFGRAIMQEEKLPNGLPLNQVIELRALINDQIGRGEALGSIPDRYLKRLSGALTQSIEGAVEKVENAEVKAALGKANVFYKTNAPKFEQRGVADLFHEDTMGGFVDDSRAVSRLFDGRGDLDMLRRYESLLGAGSPEYKALLRTGVQRILDNSTPIGEKFIDAGSLLQRVGGLDPEVRKQVLGSVEKDLVDNAKLLDIARGKKIDAADVEEILSSAPGKVADKLKAAIAKQETFDRAYNSRLMRQLVDGRFDPATLNPDEFVSRFVHNASTQEARQVMTQLAARSPEVANDIRKRTMLDFLNRASAAASPDDAVTDRVGKLSYDEMLRSLKKDGDKLQAIVGKSAVDSLTDLAKIEAVRAKAQQQGGQAGQLVYSNILAAFMDFKISEVPRILKNRIIAKALTTPGVKEWMAKTTHIQPTPAARRAVFSSPPIVRAIIEEFRDEPDLLGQVLDAAALGPDGANGIGEAKTDAPLRDWLEN